MTLATTLGGLAAVGASVAVLRAPRLAHVDRWFGRLAVLELGHHGDHAIAAATDLGSVYAIAGSAAVLARTGRRDVATDVAVAGALAWTVAQLLKGPVGRPRPYEAEQARRLVHEPAGSSWPSGHAAVAAGIAAATWPRLRPGRRAVVGALPTFVAASRVYVGVHYPSDVLAGAGIGVLSAVAGRLSVEVVRRLRG